MTTSIQDHYKNIRYVFILTLIFNWAVALAKIYYGFFSNCISMSADGFHSLSDGASNIIGIIGIHFASQPVDTDHPYGHKKYETLFSMGIALLLFLLAFNLIIKGINQLNNPVIPKIDMISFVIMIITMLVNIIVMKYEYKKGKQLGSDLLTSDAMHTKADILTSLSVIISLIFIKSGYPIIDPISTIVISIFIAFAGYNIIKKGSQTLCDTQAIVDVKKIFDIVLKIDGVKTCHKIRTRGRLDDIHIDMHVQVNPDMHIDNAHKICYKIENSIKKEIPEITDVIIHIEPKER
ncbi:MAG: cation transporter [Candidatus Firestonebacteria bacterium]|nr:cation transporter [Candidatus Firestonebacteria bacterium]